MPTNKLQAQGKHRNCVYNLCWSKAWGVHGIGVRSSASLVVEFEQKFSCESVLVCRVSSLAPFAMCSLPMAKPAAFRRHFKKRFSFFVKQRPEFIGWCHQMVPAETSATVLCYYHPITAWQGEPVSATLAAFARKGVGSTTLLPYCDISFTRQWVF